MSFEQFIDPVNAFSPVMKTHNLNITGKHETSSPAMGNPGILASDSNLISLMNDVKPTQNFDLWAAVDVPGSPLLSRLFEALQIECSGTIPTISIGSPIVESAQNYLADAKISDTSKGEQIDCDAVKNSEVRESYLLDCSSEALGIGDPNQSQPE
jgi:hypothetical protein